MPISHDSGVELQVSIMRILHIIVSIIFNFTSLIRSMTGYITTNVCGLIWINLEIKSQPIQNKNLMWFSSV